MILVIFGLRIWFKANEKSKTANPRILTKYRYFQINIKIRFLFVIGQKLFEIVKILRFFEIPSKMSLLGLRSRESDYNDFMSRDQKCESWSS